MFRNVVTYYHSFKTSHIYCATKHKFNLVKHKQIYQDARVSKCFKMSLRWDAIHLLSRQPAQQGRLLISFQHFDRTFVNHKFIVRQIAELIILHLRNV